MSCEPPMSNLPFTHVVCLDGEPHKKFRSLREAKWFTGNKDNATIVELPVETIKSVFDILEEAPF